MKPHSQTESKPFKNTWQVLVQNYKSFVVTIPYFNLIFISSALSYSIVIPYLINIKSTPQNAGEKGMISCLAWMEPVWVFMKGVRLRG
jgi:hypothetical protein